MTDAETITTLQAKIAGLEGERDAAIREMTGYAREAGDAKGRLEMSEAAGIVDGWRARCEAAEQALEGRDKFLVKRGMWDAFVSQLDGGKP